MVLCCAVKGCKQESYPGSGVSFHRLPSNRRHLWLAAMKLDPKLSRFAAVCGKHFKQEDYVNPLSSKLKKNAVPSILNPDQLHPFQYITPYIERNTNENSNDEVKTSVKDDHDSEDDQSDSEKSEKSDSDQSDQYDSDATDCSDNEENGVQEKITFEGVCRTCLCNDRKLFDISPKNQITFSDVLIKDDPDWNGELPQRVCWECNARMTSFTAFKAKAKQATALLVSLVRTCNNAADLSIIDRDALNLSSTLISKTFDADHADNHIIHCNDFKNTHNVKNEMKIEEFDDNSDIGEEVNVPSPDIDNEEPIEPVAKKKRVPKTKKRGTKTIKKEGRTKKNLVKKEILRGNHIPQIKLDSEIFEEKFLSTTEQMEEIIKRQDTDNYKNSVFKCEYCYKGFMLEDVYNLHMRIHNDENAIYCCGICKIRYSKRQNLRRHLRQHMQKFCCKKCDYVTSMRHAAKLHEQFHSGTKYTCPHCFDNFMIKTTLLNHVRRKHATHICQFCGYAFVSEVGLKYHIKRTHRFDEKQVPEDGPWCLKCDIQFYNSEALERHLRQSAEHSNDAFKPRRRRRRFIKQQDSSSAGQAQKKHVTRKSSEPITCEQCDVKLPTPRAYFVHFRREHPDKNRTKYAMKSQIMCEICGKMFQSEAALTSHRYTHNTTKLFKCSLCNKQFMRQSGLETHERLMHGDEKPSFTCEVCAKTFTSIYNMKRHQLIHTGLKPYQCEICGKFFKDLREKRAHVSYVHLKKPWPKRVRVKTKETKQNISQPSQSTISKATPVRIYVIKRKQ